MEDGSREKFVHLLLNHVFLSCFLGLRRCLVYELGFRTAYLTWVGLGCMFPSLQVIGRTERLILFEHWQKGEEKRRGEGGRGMECRV